MRRIVKYSVGFVALLALVSSMAACEAFSNLIHDGEVVARVGRHKLYRSTLEEYIPKGMSEEDSTALALQYINSWATSQLFVDEATSRLSKEEKDVTEEMEDYKNSLLRFRYEQRYVREHLDTLISREELTEYWESHSNLFVLDFPVVKARILDIDQNSSSLEDLSSLMASSNPADLQLADSIAFSAAFKYVDYSMDWQSVQTLCKQFDVPMAAILPKMAAEQFSKYQTEGGEIKLFYICEMVAEGRIAPLEFCEERIRDIILSSRKRALLNDLERELLEDAKEKENLKIY